MKHPVLCLLVLLTALVSRAQTDVTDYNIRHFTSENGLSQNSVKSIGRDDYGFIWLATESGLLRFDGSSFRQFDKNNTGTQTSRVADILRSPDGTKLLAVSGTQNIQELILISQGKATKYAAGFQDVFLPEALREVRFKPAWWLHRIPGLDNILFPLEGNLGAFIRFGKNITWYTDKGIIGHTALQSIQERDEIFPLGHALYHGAPRLAGDTLQRITPEGIARVPIRGDFLKLASRKTREQRFVESHSANGQTFLYAGNYLYRLLPLKDGSIDTRLLLSGFDLDEHKIYCTYYDSLYHRVIMGSLTEGLYVLDRKKFRAAVFEGKDADPMVNVIYDHVAMNDSTILTVNGIRFCTNPAVRPVFKALHSTTLFRSQSGKLWAGGIYHAYMMDSNAAHIKKEWACGLPMAITEGKDGRIWLGTDGTGLYALDPNRPQAEPLLMLPGHDRIMSLVWEEDELLWICTVRHLLRMNTGTGAVDTLHSMRGKMTRSLYISRPGEVWMCTYEDGLFLWQAGKLTHFPTRNYPHLKTVHKILEDDKGFFWISTNHGIYQVRKKDLLAYAQNTGKQQEPYFFYYSKESGFLTNEFNGGSQYVGTKLGNGFFSFSSINGVVFFNPSAMRPELPEGTIIIDKLEVDDKEINPGEGRVSLNRNFRTLKVTPTSAYMGNPANLKYEFRLNDDVEWRSTYNGSVILSSLPVGNNEIFIRKKTGFGEDNYTTCSLLLYVPPAWWETRGFYAAVLLGLIVLVWLTTRLRVRYWKKRNALLEAAVGNRTQDLKDIVHDLERSENMLGEQLQFQRMLNENITHDITTPLKYLTLFTGKTLVKAREESPALSADAEYIYEGTSRIYEVVRDLGQYMRSRLSLGISTTKLYLHSLVLQKAALFEIAAAQGGNVIENKVDPGLFVNQNESLISIIVHNLIDNAVKHTENGKISVTATAENGMVQLSIADTGRGMNASQIQAYNDYFREPQHGSSRSNTGFGFQIIREIALLLKLKIVLERTMENGLIVVVAIPKNER